MGFLRQEYWSGFPFSLPVEHILLELSTMTRPSWVAGYDMVHSFIELHVTVIHVIILVSFLWLCLCFWRLWNCSSCFFCLPSDGWGLMAYAGFLMGGTGCGENWVLLWWRPSHTPRHIWLSLLWGHCSFPWVLVRTCWSVCSAGVCFPSPWRFWSV